MEIVAYCVIKSWFTPALPDLLYCHCQIMHKFSETIIIKYPSTCFIQDQFDPEYTWSVDGFWVLHEYTYSSIFSAFTCVNFEVSDNLHIVKQDVQLVINIFADVLASNVAGPLIGIMVITRLDMSFYVVCLTISIQHAKDKILTPIYNITISLKTLILITDSQRNSAESMCNLRISTIPVDSLGSRESACTVMAMFGPIFRYPVWELPWEGVHCFCYDFKLYVQIAEDPAQLKKTCSGIQLWRALPRNSNNPCVLNQQKSVLFALTKWLSHWRDCCICSTFLW